MCSYLTVGKWFNGLFLKLLSQSLILCIWEIQKSYFEKARLRMLLSLFQWTTTRTSFLIVNCTTFHPCLRLWWFPVTYFHEIKIQTLYNDIWFPSWLSSLPLLSLHLLLNIKNTELLQSWLTHRSSNVPLFLSITLCASHHQDQGVPLIYFEK